MTTSPPTVLSAGGAPLSVAPVMSVDPNGDYAAPGSSERLVRTVTYTPVITPTPHAAGDVIGTLMPFANIAREGVGSGVLQNALVSCRGPSTANMDLLIFSSLPTSSSFVDSAPLAVSSDDVSKIVAIAHITDWTDCGTPAFAQVLDLNVLYALGPSSTVLRAVLVARNALTPSGTSDFSVTLSVYPD